MKQPCLTTLIPALLAASPAAMAQSLLWEVPGSAGGDRLGRGIASIRDLDGDGTRDLLVGAPQNSDGSGYVLALSGATGATIWSFDGAAAWDSFGRSVADAGDTDLDGVSDILVGAPLANGQGGEARLYSGATGALLHTFSPSSIERLGISVAGVGDVDGDGASDVVLGAYFKDVAGMTWAGRAVVYSGLTGALLFEFVGERELEQFGRDVAGPGDVNSDGVPDVLVGSDGEGLLRVTLFSGLDGTVIHSWTRSDGSTFGHAVSGAGDVDQDGHPDLAVGAPSSNSTTGDVSIFSGADGSLIRLLQGNVPGDAFGGDLAEAGDVTGDGVPDLLVGSAIQGLTRLYSGASGALVAEFESPPNGPTVTTGLEGNVAGLGDVNGDGQADIAVGWPFQTSLAGEEVIGLVQVLSLAPPGPPADASLSTIAAAPTQVGFLGTSTVTVTPRDATGVPLGAGQQILMTTSDGAFLGPVVDHGDGTYSRLLQCSADGQASEVTAEANGVVLLSTATVTPAIPLTIALATGDAPAQGQQLGGTTFLDTHQWDALGTNTSSRAAQKLREEETNGNPANRRSVLDHRWPFSVPAGGTATFFVAASHAASADGDGFEFSFAPAGGSFAPMLVIDRGLYPGYHAFELPAGTSGAVTIRVVDTDRTPGNRSLDSIDVRHMGVAVEAGSLGPPVAPTGLNATTASSSRIDLTWTDASNDEDGFEVERSTDGVSWTLIATLPANSTGHASTGLAAETEYLHRVVAFNLAGASGPSNVAAATTLAGAGPQDDRADADLAVEGTVTGDHTATWADDDTYQSILERESGGKPSRRTSRLEHKWTFDVSGGSSVTFHLQAHHDTSMEGDDFVFAYSLDDATYVDMVTVVKTTDDGTYQTFALPSSVAGTVWVRVRDTDRTRGARSLEAVHVDDMFIRSGS